MDYFMGILPVQKKGPTRAKYYVLFTPRFTFWGRLALSYFRMKNCRCTRYNITDARDLFHIF